MLVSGHHEYAFKICDEAGAVYNPYVDISISRVEDGELLGGVVYQNYTGESIAIHMAGFVPNWANRDILWAAFHYPFEQLKVKRLFGLVPESNTAALEIDLKLGFKEVTRIPGMFDDGAAVIVGMEKSDCRWLKLKPQKIHSARGT